MTELKGREHNLGKRMRSGVVMMKGTSQIAEYSQKEPKDIQEQMREEIAKTMYYQHVTPGFVWENEGQWFRDKYLKRAEEILSRTLDNGRYHLAIVDELGEVPEIRMGETHYYLRKAGWRQTI